MKILKKLYIKEVTNAIQGELIQGNENDSVDNVSRDSRETNDSTLFFFLVGENQDGHKFLNDVISKGTKNLVISNKECLKNIKNEILLERGDAASSKIFNFKELNIIHVEDTTKALQSLAKYYLNLVSPKVVGITGSVGKTSTKDMVSQILSSKYKTVKTKGNYNNEIGLPLTIFNIEEETEIAVLEMGADNFGDIKSLINIANPDIGIITNIGTSHIEKFGSRDGILNEKMSISTYFDDKNCLVYAPDGEYLVEKKMDFPVILIKKENGNDGDLIIKNVVEKGEFGNQFELAYKGDSVKFELEAIGAHNVVNCALAVAAGLKCGISLQEASAAIKGIEITKGRLSIAEKNGIKIIDDTYNASPLSVKAAIDLLMKVEGKRKVAFLGDMLELGEFSEASHIEIGEYSINKGVDVLVAIGEKSRNTYKAAIDLNKSIDGKAKKVIHYKDRKNAIRELKSILKFGDVVLFKGSRSMHLEEIINEM